MIDREMSGRCPCVRPTHRLRLPDSPTLDDPRPQDVTA